MANEWFCRIAGKELGPLSPQQLKAMAVKGQLLPQHEIRRGKAGTWSSAGAVAGLFPKTDSSPGWADTAEIPVAAAKRVPPAKVPAKRPPAAQRPEANPLDVFLAEPEPIAKPSGRSHKGGDAIVAHRQQEQMLWKICGIGGIVLLIVGVIAIYAFTRNKDQPTAGGLEGLAAKTKEAKSEAKTAAKPEPKKEDAKTAAKTAETPKPKEEPKPKPEPPTDEVQWVDAAKDSAVRGDVKTRIISTDLGKPRVVVIKDGELRDYPGDALLMVTVELQNTGKKKIEYSGWGLPGEANKGIELVDNRKRPSARPVFRTYRPERQLTKATVLPGETVEDVVFFLPPPRDERTEFLHLTLPAAAFGEKGTLNFKIPADMIKTAAPAKGKPTDPDAKPPLVPDDGAGDGIGIPAKKPAELDPDAEVERIRRAHEEAMGELVPPEGQ